MQRSIRRRTTWFIGQQGGKPEPRTLGPVTFALYVMMQSPMLQFESEAFDVHAEEDEATNPGIYGKSLAAWLREKLLQRSLAAEEVVAEDFGWCVPVPQEPHRTYVACASDEEQSGSWRVFVFVEGGLMARILGKDRRGEALATVYGAVKECLSQASEVKNLREESQ